MPGCLMIEDVQNRIDFDEFMTDNGLMKKPALPDFVMRKKLHGRTCEYIAINPT